MTKSRVIFRRVLLGLNSGKMNNLFYEDVIVGSGPNGWAAAHGVWARNGQPLILDIGNSTSSSNGESVVSDPKFIPKTLFGQNFMYRYPVFDLGLSIPESTVPVSGALGGFSTVWGSGIQPVSNKDLNGMPEWCSRDWMEASLKLLERIEFLGRDDLLSMRDPWPIAPHDEVVLSDRFQKILSMADKNLFESSGRLAYGSPRLAIRGSSDQSRDGACTLCGKCMTGCAENSIFDSGRELLKDMQANGGRYLRALVLSVDLVRSGELSGKIRLLIQHDDSSQSFVFAERAYLAAGPIGTPLLLQRSGLITKEIVINDSQMFYGAFVTFRRSVRSKNFMTTSQGYFSTGLTTNFEDEFSMSVYESTDDFKIRFRALFPKPLKWLGKILSPLTRQIVPGIGFLSQDVSGSMVLSTQNSNSQLTLSANTMTNNAIRSANKRIRKSGRKIGLYMIPNPLAKANIGAGFHAGASLPMGDAPENLVNWQGCLKEHEGIYLVDATSLPRIKAGSHTFMAMANAYRIAAAGGKK
jgi:choline dehydrogenase-like flavoprotein